jgi:hypothetical protein
MKNSSYTIGNRTRDLPACCAVPQPTALPRAPKDGIITPNIKKLLVQKQKKTNLKSIQKQIKKNTNTKLPQASNTAQRGKIHKQGVQGH